MKEKVQWVGGVQGGETGKSQYSKLWKEQNKVYEFIANSNALERNNINALERLPHIQNFQSNTGEY